MLWVQKTTFVLGRMIFYMLLIPSLIGLIYTLTYQLWTGALIFIILCVVVLYIGLIRIRIPAHSLVVLKGKVVCFIPEKTVRDRFDFASRGQTIVQLPYYDLIDRFYKLEIFSPDNQGGLNSCRLKLNLGYIMDMTGWQRAYDNYVRYQDRYSSEVKKQLFKSSAQLKWPSPLPVAADVEEYLKPIVAELDRGLENLGLKIEEATCTFAAGPTFVRLVAGEQENVEKALSSGEAS